MATRVMTPGVAGMAGRHEPNTLGPGQEIGLAPGAGDRPGPRAPLGSFFRRRSAAAARLPPPWPIARVPPPPAGTEGVSRRISLKTLLSEDAAPSRALHARLSAS
ncbi:unnamed protein product [Lampetra fluviatilis]